MRVVGMIDHLRHVVVGEPDARGVYTVRCGKRFLRHCDQKAAPGSFVECPECAGG